MNKRNKVAIMCLFLTHIAFGQQEAQITQYLDNMLYYNPAYAGSNNHMNATFIHRQQWIGIQGAPNTQCLSIHTPLKYESLGVGLSIINDRLGPLNQKWINIDVSYSLKFKNNKGKLSLGIKGGLNFIDNNLTDLNVLDQNDVNLSSNISQITPNFGAGLYYHSEQFFAGFSSPRIIQNTVDNGSPDQLFFINRRHYYTTVGGYFNVNRMIKLRPSLLFKFVPNAPFALDGSLAVIFYDKLWLGANYRMLESAGIFCQIQFKNQLKIGYGFDLSTNELLRHNPGTHEIMISYDFSFKKNSITSCRYF